MSLVFVCLIISDLLFLESSEVVFRVAVKLLEIHQDELMLRDNFEDIMNYMKNTMPDIDTATMDKVMKDVFTMDIKKQLIEYQVEYNVLQEEINTAQHYMESLNREKENYTQLESKLQVMHFCFSSFGNWLKWTRWKIQIFSFFQFAESSIAQLEKTRSSQQSQIQSLQMQVQSLETTVETLGQFMLQLIEKSGDIEASMPGDVQRILQQVGNLNAHRKKPIFVERKIGKSMSMNAQLGFPMKILEELESNSNNNNNDSKPKSAFFENTYMQLRKQSTRNRPTLIETKDDENIPPEASKVPPTMTVVADITPSPNNGDAMHIDCRMNGNTPRKNDGLDSGIATPLSPKENSITSIVETIPGKNSMATIEQVTTAELHPFGNCEDVNFNYSSTQLKQLKSLRPIHLRNVTPAIGSEKHIDGRS